MEELVRIPFRSLTIYLIKESIKNDKAILRRDVNVEEFPIESGSRVIGKLYMERKHPKTPKWAELFKGYLDYQHFQKVNSSSALFIVNTGNRTYAIPFGQGRHIINQGCWEERFGLIVSLNAIGENKIKSIDKQTFDSILRHSREQAGREATANDFGIDIEQDLLRAVTGTPEDTSLGNRIAGIDSLLVSARIELDQIPELLDRYFALSVDESYKTKYPWVDHVNAIKDSTLADELDKILVNHINGSDYKRCWAAVPEPIDWTKVNGFQYSKAHLSPIYSDIHISEFLESTNHTGAVDIEILKRHYVYCIGENDDIIDSWHIYRCIYCEVDYREDFFLLNGGKWFRVTRDFVKDINTAFTKIPKYTHTLPKYNDSSEEKYCQRVSSENNNNYALMDQKFIYHGGGRSKIEFCDLYSATNDLIHIKKYGAASVLSHLFSQGLVSGELFIADAEFRRKVNDKLPDSHKIDGIDKRPGLNDYQIVYAIISDSDDEWLTLPFFSKLNIRHAVRRLEGYGYRVSLAKIPVDEEIKKTKKYREKRRQ